VFATRAMKEEAEVRREETEQVDEADQGVPPLTPPPPAAFISASQTLSAV